MVDLKEVDDVAIELYRRRPPWLTAGSLSYEGTRFLAREVAQCGGTTAVEIGTATGFSTAVVASVLALVTKETGTDFRVSTFDLLPQWYLDASVKTGDAARLLVPHLLPYIDFYNPATAVDVRDRVPAGSASVLLIDASHRHPWPTIDFLLSMESLTPEATVVFDDISLPLRLAEFPHWGAHWLFYGLPLERRISEVDDQGYPWMGSVRLTSNKSFLRSQLLHILDAHEWQADVPREVEQAARQAACGDNGQPA